MYKIYNEQIPWHIFSGTLKCLYNSTTIGKKVIFTFAVCRWLDQNFSETINQNLQEMLWADGSNRPPAGPQGLQQTQGDGV